MITLADVRRAVEQALGSAFSDQLWDHMVEYRYVADMPGITEDEVAYAIRAARDLAMLGEKPVETEEPAATKEPRSETPGRPRKAAGDAEECRRSISALLAGDAAARDEIVDLRAQIGPLQQWDEVEPWLEAHVRRERDDLAGAGWVDLTYSLPGGTAVRRRRVRTGGLLDELKQVGDALADAYGWQPAQAIVWVLTGISPAFERMYADRVTFGSGLGTTDRLVLTIDPGTPAAEVAAFYRQARGQPTGRTLSARHARLAAFVAERPVEPWRRRMEVWNALHPSPGWRYDHISNMIRDAAVAKDRLLRPRLGARP